MRLPVAFHILLFMKLIIVAAAPIERFENRRCGRHIINIICKLLSKSIRRTENWGPLASARSVRAHAAESGGWAGRHRWHGNALFGWNKCQEGWKKLKRIRFRRRLIPLFRESQSNIEKNRWDWKHSGKIET